MANRNEAGTRPELNWNACDSNVDRTRTTSLTRYEMKEHTSRDGAANSCDAGGIDAVCSFAARLELRFDADLSSPLGCSRCTRPERSVSTGEHLAKFVWNGRGCFSWMPERLPTETALLWRLQLAFEPRHDAFDFQGIRPVAVEALERARSFPVGRRR